MTVQLGYVLVIQGALESVLPLPFLPVMFRPNQVKIVDDLLWTKYATFGKWTFSYASPAAIGIHFLQNFEITLTFVHLKLN